MCNNRGIILWVFGLIIWCCMETNGLDAIFEADTLEKEAEQMEASKSEAHDGPPRTTLKDLSDPSAVSSENDCVECSGAEEPKADNVEVIDSAVLDRVEQPNKSVKLKPNVPLTEQQFVLRLDERSKASRPVFGIPLRVHQVTGSGGSGGGVRQFFARSGRNLLQLMKRMVGRGDEIAEIDRNRDHIPHRFLASRGSIGSQMPLSNRQFGISLPFITLTKSALISPVPARALERSGIPSIKVPPMIRLEPVEVGEPVKVSLPKMRGGETWYAVYIGTEHPGTFLALPEEFSWPGNLEALQTVASSAVLATDGDKTDILTTYSITINEPRSNYVVWVSSGVTLASAGGIAFDTVLKGNKPERQYISGIGKHTILVPEAPSLMDKYENKFNCPSVIIPHDIFANEDLGIFLNRNKEKYQWHIGPTAPVVPYFMMIPNDFTKENPFPGAAVQLGAKMSQIEKYDDTYDSTVVWFSQAGSYFLSFVAVDVEDNNKIIALAGMLVHVTLPHGLTQPRISKPVTTITANSQTDETTLSETESRIDAENTKRERTDKNDNARTDKNDNARKSTKTVPRVVHRKKMKRSSTSDSKKTSDRTNSDRTNSDRTNSDRTKTHHGDKQKQTSNQKKSTKIDSNKTVPRSDQKRDTPRKEVAQQKAGTIQSKTSNHQDTTSLKPVVTKKRISESIKDLKTGTNGDTEKDTLIVKNGENTRKSTSRDPDDVDTDVDDNTTDEDELSHLSEAI